MSSETLALALAAGTLAVFVVTIALGGALKAGLAPWPGLAAIAMSTLAFFLSGRSLVVGVLLAAAGLVGVVYGAIVTEFLTLVAFPGPIIGMAIGVLILGLGITKVIAARVR